MIRKCQPEQHGVESKKGGINDSDECQIDICPLNNSPRDERQNKAGNGAEKPAGMMTRSPGFRR